MSKNGIIILASLFLTIWAGVSLKDLQFDFELRPLTTKNSEEFKNFQSYNKHFKSDIRSLSLAIEFEGKDRSLEEMRKVDSLLNQLSRLESVEEVWSITNIPLYRKGLNGPVKQQLLSLENEEKFRKKWAKLDRYTDITPKFLSKNKQFVAAHLNYLHNRSGLFEEVRKELEPFKFKQVHYHGVLARQSKKDDRIFYDFLLLPLIALGLTVVLFMLFFKDWKALLTLLMTLAFNLSTSLALFVLFDITVGELCLTVPVLLLVISFCDLIHLLHKSKSIEGKQNKIWTQMNRPLWMTSFTTLMAFGVFFLSDIEEIQEFALITCCGVVILYLGARIVFTAWIEVLKPSFYRGSWRNGISSFVLKLGRRPKLITRLSFLMIGVLLFLAFRSFQIDFKRQYSDSQQIANEEFDGNRAIEVIIEGENLLNDEHVQLVDTIDQFLRSEYHCNAVFSVNTAIKRLNRYNARGIASQFKLPAELSDEFKNDLIKYKDELGLGNAIDSTHSILRIVGRCEDRGTAIAMENNEKLDQFISQFESKDRKLFISGYHYSTDQSIVHETEIICIGMGLSMFVAVLIITFFYGIRFGLSLFLANALPIICGLALFPLMGLSLEPSTAIAFSIVLGLSLDDSIYLISGVKAHGNVPMISSLREHSFPAVVTSVILICGFMVLSSSSIEQNQNIGTLVAIILGLALICDLLILPALINVSNSKD